MGMPAVDGPATFAPNRSPHVQWQDLPAGTLSLALICVDHDAPSERETCNRPDMTVPYDLPRSDFYHWVLVDIPVDRNELEPGIDSEGVTPRGKSAGPTSYGVRGLNSYTDWFAGDPDMEGFYAGYDGPFPPWNDERIHRYKFTLYALKVPSLNLEGNFTGDDALQAMQGHILASSSWMGTYAIYPEAVAPESE